MKYIIGNWKMNGSIDMGWKLALDLHQFLATHGKQDRAVMVVCPPFPYIAAMTDFLSRHNSALAVGGQNCHAAESGAFTGEISAAMLRDIGCGYVILGHSERRQYCAETDAAIAAKILAAQKQGLVAVLCIGESQAQKQSNQTLDILTAQLQGCLGTGIDTTKLIVAYEPIWAIGTGLNATRDDIQSAHVHIRTQLQRILANPGAGVPILYGGSVKASNAAEILATQAVDGVLVGGASLQFAEFSQIYACA